MILQGFTRSTPLDLVTATLHAEPLHVSVRPSFVFMLPSDACYTLVDVIAQMLRAVAR